MTEIEMTTGSVASADGTTIGYWKTGRGPAVVLLHGSMESARSHTLLARALADEFTVYLPDRRGRGLSGPHRPDHGIRTEVEDLAAVVEAAGAHLAFGVSAGGLVVLEAARRIPAIEQVAVYEPALLTDGTRHTSWLARFDEELARGDVAAAMITSMFGLDLAPPIFKVFPRRLLAALTTALMNKEDRAAAPDTITMRKLAPTIHYEGVILAELADSVHAYRDLRAEVLLMGGSKGLAFLEPARDALVACLPRSRRVEFPGFDHGASSDPSSTNQDGRPENVERIATEIRTFFAPVRVRP
ncbi:alpha/beta hydrolase [Asanoa sp. NPDC049518]|uniref:alpha/beta fold hydrolase n=1 Tax=unclassified Asanoa TaxID=2685164 RepID=UPI00341F058A